MVIPKRCYPRFLNLPFSLSTYRHKINNFPYCYIYEPFFIYEQTILVESIPYYLHGCIPTYPSSHTTFCYAYFLDILFLKCPILTPIDHDRSYSRPLELFFSLMVICTSRSTPEACHSSTNLL